LYKLPRLNSIRGRFLLTLSSDLHSKADTKYFWQSYQSIFGQTRAK